ncbi:MAG: CoA transferase [Neisseriaceae bacterium]|nr:CoA transferase [Neisseriaceae bacterium]
MSTQALAGIKVLDLSRVLAGPSCTQHLADLGAEVIKIERPEVGDETRTWAPPSFADGTSAYFAGVNRNKRSVTVNLSTPEGQDLIKKMIVEADVLMENYKVGGLQKYGLDYAQVQALNPRLIYCSLTGFGQSGPDAKRPGYDYIIQGMSGLMSITGPSEGLPFKVGVAVVDLFTGLQATVGIQAALIERAKSGLGQWIDVSLLDCAVNMLANVGMNYLATGEVPPRLGNAHPNIVPYQVFETGQDQHLILACGNNQQFAAVAAALGHPEWATDPRFLTNPDRVAHREALIALMVPCFMNQGRDEWLSVLEAAGVPCGPINNIAEAFAMPQVQARAMSVALSESDRAMTLIGNPLKLSRTPVQYQSLPPKLGQHTQEVLKEMGISDELIVQLKNKKII